MTAIALDLSKLVTAEDIAAQEALATASAIKAECRALILSVVDETAQANLLAAVAVGGLTEAQLETFASGVAWIAAMRAECAARIGGGGGAWPAVPTGVAELAAAF